MNRCAASAPNASNSSKGKVDVVVNLAGVVDFDPPVNESFEPNVYGTQHLIELVQLLETKLVHVSTCYVAGKRNGRISEDTPIDGYFPRQETSPDEHFSVAKNWSGTSNSYGNTREPRRESAAGARTPARRRHEPRGTMGLDEHLYLHEEHGGTIAREDPGLKYCIVRPAIVESSMEFPFPGWNEGFTTSAPLVLMGGEGVKGWPVRKDGPLEIIPVDLVAQGILIVAAAVLCGKARRVYHLASADENPIMLPRLVAFLGMNSRYKHKHKKEGNRLANAWKAYVETQVITVESLQARRSRLHRGLDVIHAALTLGKDTAGRPQDGSVSEEPSRYAPADPRAGNHARQVSSLHVSQQLYLRDAQHSRNAPMLTNEDLKRINWDPETIDWADYWVNIHTKGIESGSVRCLRHLERRHRRRIYGNTGHLLHGCSLFQGFLREAGEFQVFMRTVCDKVIHRT